MSYQMNEEKKLLKSAESEGLDKIMSRCEMEFQVLSRNISTPKF